MATIIREYFDYNTLEGLRKLRKELKLTQSEFSILMDVSLPSIQKAESSRGKWTRFLGNKLATLIDKLNEPKDAPVVVEPVKEEKKENPVIDTVTLLQNNKSVRHKNYPLLLKNLSCEIPTWLYGEAGSGKSTGVMLVAKELGLPFYCLSVCPMTTKSEFMGYRDAHGNYHDTAFRQAYQHGGVYLVDEIDNGNPSVLSVLNSAIAQPYCSFPDGIVTRHKDFRFVATANTIGKGATASYVGRNRLDGATLDRFSMIEWHIDERLEAAILALVEKAKEELNIKAGGNKTPREWLDYVRACRYICRDFNINHIVSTRASIYGKKLLEAGVGFKHVTEMTIYKGMNKSDRTKITSNVKKYLDNILVERGEKEAA
jgi:transcriptional regulator with XRE-family HTH domain